MINQDQIKNQLEGVFEKYKFTKEERSKVILDLVQLGETLVFNKLFFEMTPEKQSIFDKKMVSTKTPENKVKYIYAFLAEVCGEAKLNEVRGSVYDKLVADYIAHMSK